MYSATRAANLQQGGGWCKPCALAARKLGYWRVKAMEDPELRSKVTEKAMSWVPLAHTDLRRARWQVHPPPSTGLSAAGPPAGALACAMDGLGPHVLKNVLGFCEPCAQCIPAMAVASRDVRAQVFGAVDIVPPLNVRRRRLVSVTRPGTRVRMTRGGPVCKKEQVYTGYCLESKRGEQAEAELVLQAKRREIGGMSVQIGSKRICTVKQEPADEEAAKASQPANASRAGDLM